MPLSHGWFSSSVQEGQKEGVVEEEVEGRNKSVTPKEYLRERENYEGNQSEIRSKQISTRNILVPLPFFCFIICHS